MVTEVIAANISANLSEAVNATQSSGNIHSFLLSEVIPRFVDLIKAPVSDPQMLWIVSPLVAALVLMEFYFGHYNREELGWNTAVGNSLVLIFISLDLLRTLNSQIGLNITELINHPTELPVKIIIAGGLGVFGLLNMFGNFFHILPKKVAFKISGALPVNLIAYLSIILIYTDIPFDWTTILASFLLFLCLLIIFSLLHLFEPKAKDIFEDFHKKFNQLNDPDSLATKEIREDPFTRNFEDHGGFQYRLRPTKRKFDD